MTGTGCGWRRFGGGGGGRSRRRRVGWAADTALLVTVTFVGMISWMALRPPLPVQAQSPVDAAQRPLDAETRAIFDAGQNAFAARRFEAALDAFQRAHARSGRPAMLFNIGATAERLGRVQEALLAYEAYVAALPTAPNRRAVDARIVVLRDSLGRDARVPESPPAPEVRTPPAAPSARDPSSAAAPAAAATTQRSARDSGVDIEPLPGTWASDAADHHHHDSNPARVAGTVVAGVLLAGAGGALVAIAGRDRRAVENADPGSSWESVSDEYERSPRRSAIGMTLIGAGAAATITGVALAIGNRVRRGNARDAARDEARDRAPRVGFDGSVTRERVEVSAWTRF